MEDQAKFDAMLEFLTAPYRAMMAEAFVTGRAIRVFVENDQIRMEIVDPYLPAPPLIDWQLCTCRTNVESIGFSH